MLARSLQGALGSMISNCIISSLKDNNFIEKFRRDDKCFTRASNKLPFDTLFLFIAFLRQRSTALEIDDFLSQIKEVRPDSRSFEDSAFFHARSKILPEAFLEVNDRVIQCYREVVGIKKWKDWELVAVDGTTARLPKTPKVSKVFPPEKCENLNDCQPICRILSMMSVDTRLTLALEVAPYQTGETSMLMDLSDKFQPGQLIIADRNFDSPWIFRLLESKGCEYVIRLAKNAFKEADLFRESVHSEAIVDLPLRSESKTRCEDLDIGADPLRVRLCKIELPTGEIEILCTSLTDSERVTLTDISELYAKRWGIEEQFKHQKARVEIENFSGKSAVSVLQDIYGAIMSNNLMLMYSQESQPAIDTSKRGAKYKYTVCWAKALGYLKNNFMTLVYISKKFSNVKLDFIEHCVRHSEPIRPGRKSERKHKRKRDYYMCYKPTT